MSFFGSLFDVQVPFFVPLWRRVLVTALTALWTIFEVVRGELGWALLFGAAAAYLAHQFFIAWKPKPPSDDSAP